MSHAITTRRIERNSLRGVAALAIFPLLAAIGCRHAGGSSAADDGPVRVGLVFADAGATAVIEREAARGARLALRDAGPSIEVIAFEGIGEAAPDSDALREFAGRSDVAIGFTDTSLALAALPAFVAEGVPVVTAGATDPTLPDRAGGDVFLVSFGDNTQAAAAAEWATVRAGKTAVVLFDESSAYCRALAAYFRTAMDSIGGTVAAEASFRGSEGRAEAIEAIRGAGAFDFVFLAALPEGSGELVGAIRAAGIAAQPIVGGDGLDTPDIRRAGEIPNDQVIYTTHVFFGGQEGTTEAADFLARYAAEYGSPPETAFAALGYDAASLVLDAARRAGTRDRDALARAIAATRDFPGITGRISYTDGSGVPAKTVWIVAIWKGVPRMVETYRPRKVPAPDRSAAE